MSRSVFSLLHRSEFAPLFASQTLGALNDNLFKNALLILITYELVGFGPEMVTLGTGVFILPFLMFSALGGELADRVEKAQWIRRLKLLEIAIMVIAAIGFVIQSVTILFSALFLMGAQSALMSPVKFALLPQQIPRSELVGANGLLSAGMFLATLLGTISGTALGGSNGAIATLLALAVIGYVASRWIPAAPIDDPNLRVDLRPWAAIARVWTAARAHRPIFLALLGIGWFYLLGATFLGQFSNYAKGIFNADNQVVNLFLSTFLVGIATGSLLCHRLLKGEITLRLLPFAALGVAVFAIDLYFSSRTVGVVAAEVAGAFEFIAHPGAWRILADLLGLSVCGGLYVVPLYAFIQAQSPESERSRMFGAMNVINASLAVAATLFIIVLYKGLGLDTAQVFLVAAIAHLVVLAYILRLLLRTTLKSVLATLLRLLFRVRVQGMEHYPASGERAIIVANHQSYLDAPLLVGLLPDIPTFAIGSHVAEAWWVKPWLNLVKAYPMLPTNPFAIKGLTNRARQGERCVIFPEGRITETGALMKVYDGPGLVAVRSDALVVPVRIEGAQYSFFSLLGGKVRRRLLPKISLTILPPRRLEIPENVVGRERREIAGQQLKDLMTDMLFEASDRELSVFQTVLNAAKRHGGSRAMLSDPDRGPLDYRSLLIASIVLGDRLRAGSEAGERVGLMLPNAVGACIAFLSLHAWGRVPVMLNFTQGDRDWEAACRAAELKRVLTSRRFVERAGLEARIDRLAGYVEVVYLEDIRDKIRFKDRLAGLIAYQYRQLVPHRDGHMPDDPAVVLFTSGSEGQPKGVVLSHRNLIANIQQVRSLLDVNPLDRVFNALPMFHSFGLTVGTLMPLCEGVPVYLYPTPLHYRIIPELVYRDNATVLFGTDTFLSGYARNAHAYDFYRVRYVIAGAEKLRDETRRIWMERYGIRIYEGYGVTETAPVLTVNTPMNQRAGTVGRLLPGVRYRIEPVAGLERGGRLVVKGPNVMLGYMRADRPGVIEPPPEGWYDTGDLVDMDSDGYLTILGRVKRFAKIAGEMVSLAAVEDLAAQAYPDRRHAVVATADLKRGQRLVLVSEGEAVDRAVMLDKARALGYSELFVPRDTVSIDEIPVLATGKLDYRALKEWVEGNSKEVEIEAVV